jgi:hypothetical protein
MKGISVLGYFQVVLFLFGGIFVSQLLNQINVRKYPAQEVFRNAGRTAVKSAFWVAWLLFATAIWSARGCSEREWSWGGIEPAARGGPLNLLGALGLIVGFIFVASLVSEVTYKKRPVAEVRREAGALLGKSVLWALLLPVASAVYARLGVHFGG